MSPTPTTTPSAPSISTAATCRRCGSGDVVARRRVRHFACVLLTAALVSLPGACASRRDHQTEPRGRVVCANPARTPASLIGPGDSAIDMRWCGPSPFPERGYWLSPNATVDDVVHSFPNLGYGLVLADVLSLWGEQDPGGGIHSMVQVRIVDAASVLGPGTGPY